MLIHEAFITKAAGKVPGDITTRSSSCVSKQLPGHTNAQLRLGKQPPVRRLGVVVRDEWDSVDTLAGQLNVDAGHSLPTVPRCNLPRVLYGYEAKQRYELTLCINHQAVSGKNHLTH